MPKPIDDTDMLVTLAEDIVAGRAETPTGAMRLHGVQRGSGQERRLLKKWAVHGDVLTAAVRAAKREQLEFRMDSLSEAYAATYSKGFEEGRQAEREARDAAMIAGTSALAQPGTAQAVAVQMSAPPSWWERITSRRAKVVE